MSEEYNSIELHNNNEDFSSSDSSINQNNTSDEAENNSLEVISNINEDSSSEDDNAPIEDSNPFNPNADVDEDGVFLPQMTEEDELVKFSDEDAIEAVLENDEDDYSESIGTITLENIKDYDPEKEIEEDQRELDETIDIEHYRVSMYSTDPDFTILVLEFDDEEDQNINDIISIFDSFKERCTDYFAEEKAEFPLFMVTLMPIKYLGRAALCFTNPITVFKTLNDDNKATHIQMLFKSENSTVARYDDVTIEDLRQIRDDIAAKERIKAEYEIADEAYESGGYNKKPIY